jgi:hypothetical protein
LDRRRILVAGKFRPPQKEEEKKGGRSMMFSKTRIAMAIYFSSFTVKIFHLFSIVMHFMTYPAFPTSPIHCREINNLPGNEKG